MREALIANLEEEIRIVNATALKLQDATQMLRDRGHDSVADKVDEAIALANRDIDEALEIIKEARAQDDN